MAGTTFTVAQLDGVTGCSLREIDPTEHPGRKVLYLKSVVINPSELATAVGVSLSSTDLFQALEITEGEVVIAAGLDSHVAGVSGALADLDFSGGSGMVLNQDLGDVSLPAGTGTAKSVYIDDATDKDTLDVQMAAQALTAAEFRVWALVARVMRGKHGA
jgi:hypothetical protein